MLPVVALVGRPNVGKSTLFNVLTRSRDALVADMPGVTRDRHYGICRLGERPFVVVDTGGLADTEEGLAGLTARQVELAIAEADLVILVVDARDGLLPTDQAILERLRRTSKPLLLVVNKIDGLDETIALADFARLGVARPLPLSASNNHGTRDLLEAVDELLPEGQAEEISGEDEGGVRVAIVGRPNVGKSTLVNRLLGEDRVIVSDVAGTTRDSIRIPLERDGRKYTLIDTAGVRRRGRIEDAVEKFSVIKTLQSIDAANVVVILLDANEGVTDQDAGLIGHALDAGRALVIAVNKWDLVEDRAKALKEIDDRLQTSLPQARGIPVVTFSALTGRHLDRLLPAVMKQYERWNTRIGTAAFNRWLEHMLAKNAPPMANGRSVRIRYGTQVKTRPPTMSLFAGRAETIPETYQRYLINGYRDAFDLAGIPIRIMLRKSKNPFDPDKH